VVRSYTNCRRNAKNGAASLAEGEIAPSKRTTLLSFLFALRREFRLTHQPLKMLNGVEREKRSFHTAPSSLDDPIRRSQLRAAGPHAQQHAELNLNY
jgi:hypothetical protein